MPDSDHKQALPPGYQLGHYRLLEVLGVGGFGVTYLGEHVSLGHRIAVKEYLPNEFAVRAGTTVHPKSPANREDFEWGLARFVDEARTLTRFRHPNLVRVSDYFEANSTAYIVMDYEDGEPLDKLLDRHGTLTEAQLKRVLLPVADGLRQVHAAGFLHRDVKPSNIFMRRSDETPVLLDFGAARNALGRKSRSMTAVVTPGYSPPEQYETDGEQGPWTDIYALSALCFRAMTGNRPEESIRRSRLLFQDRKDPLPSLEEKGVSGYSSQFLAAVDWGLRVVETERPQSLDEWLAQLGDAPAAISAGRRTGSPTPPEAPVRPVAQERAGIGAKGALLAGVVVVAVGVALYFALSEYPDSRYRLSAEARLAALRKVESSGRDRLRGCGWCPELVEIPAGQFRMGDLAGAGEANEKPVRHVRVPRFALARHETTVRQFRRFVMATGYRTDAERDGGKGCKTLENTTRGKWDWTPGRSWRSLEYALEEDQPVTCMSWSDAQAYIEWLNEETGGGWRLPSEAEWEYAARAGSETLYHFGDDASRLCEYGNVADTTKLPSGGNWINGAECADGAAYPTRVGRYLPNALGLHDMHGNLYEWTEDCWSWSVSYAGAPTDGSAWESGDCSRRVLRGGSWNSILGSHRSARRSTGTTTDRSSSDGFRVARTLAP